MGDYTRDFSLAGETIQYMVDQVKNGAELCEPSCKNGDESHLLRCYKVECTAAEYEKSPRMDTADRVCEAFTNCDDVNNDVGYQVFEEFPPVPRLTNRVCRDCDEFVLLTNVTASQLQSFDNRCPQSTSLQSGNTNNEIAG